jgi:hypothetical protein
MSEITPEEFADSEPGAKFSVFSKTVSSSLGSAVTIGGCLHNLLRNKKTKTFITSSNECTLQPKVSKGKRHGQQLTESIRFKVTLEVNVSRVKKELRPRV